MNECMKHIKWKWYSTHKHIQRCRFEPFVQPQYCIFNSEYRRFGSLLVTRGLERWTNLYGTAYRACRRNLPGMEEIQHPALLFRHTQSTFENVNNSFYPARLKITYIFVKCPQFTKDSLELSSSLLVEIHRRFWEWFASRKRPAERDKAKQVVISRACCGN